MFVSDLGQENYVLCCKEKYAQCSLIMLGVAWQAESWIDERLQKLEDPSLQHLNNLKEKLKLLQKHQAFEAEIMAHQDLITTVNMVTLHGCAGIVCL